jgi:hypothetical protein
MLINISMANSLTPGVEKKCFKSCFLRTDKYSPLPEVTASFISASRRNYLRMFML